jgi:hypothetical protein
VARASEPCTSRTSVPSRDRRAGKCFLFSKSNLAVARKNRPPSGRMPATATALRVPAESLPQQHPYSVRRRQANRQTHTRPASKSVWPRGGCSVKFRLLAAGLVYRALLARRLPSAGPACWEVLFLCTISKVPLGGCSVKNFEVAESAKAGRSVLPSNRRYVRFS